MSNAAAMRRRPRAFAGTWSARVLLGPNAAIPDDLGVTIQTKGKHMQRVMHPRALRMLGSGLVVGPGAGAVVVFCGVTREVERLEYEAYGEMADRVMARLCDEIEREIAGARLAVEHASGTLAVGELAIVIAAAAPHRAEAFAACRHAIDTLKARVPIWKKEFYADGAVWREEPAPR